MTTVTPLGRWLVALLAGFAIGKGTTWLPPFLQLVVYVLLVLFVVVNAIRLLMIAHELRRLREGIHIVDRQMQAAAQRAEAEKGAPQ